MINKFELTYSKIGAFYCLLLSTVLIYSHQYEAATDFAFVSAVLFGTKNIASMRPK